MESDKKLVSEAQKDIKNFDNIYASYFTKIKNYFKPKVSNDELIAEDLTSQTFEKALKNIDGFKWQGVSFSSWLYTIANNTLIDFYRKNKKTIKIDDEFYNNIKDESKLIEESVIEDDTETRIKEILRELSRREHTIIILKFYDGLNNKEIAEKVGISESNVGTIIHRITKKLKDRIKASQLVE